MIIFKILDSNLSGHVSIARFGDLFGHVSNVQDLQSKAQTYIGRTFMIQLQTKQLKI